MSELARWLEREARRQAARPDLLAALLSGRRLAYARHRLGFMAARMLFRTGLHALEIGLLAAAAVPFEFIAPLIVYRALCSLGSAAHWGGLEVMRERVREAMRRRQLDAARGAIERWLGLTLWAAGGALALTFVLEVGSAWSTDEIQLRDAFALACVLRLGLDSGLRVLHSGVFALRRVYRPLSSTLAPDLLELAILAAGFAALGIWAIPIAIVAGGLWDAALGYASVRRAYLQRRLQLPRIARSPFAARGFGRAELGAAGAQALANVSLQLEGLVLLLLVGAGSSGAFATLYYVLRPLMAASTHWLRTFYFDLKLVESAGLRAFRPQLMQFLERLAVAWALVLAVLTLGLAQALSGPGVAWPLLLLVPFFVVRSAFALVQLVAFGAGELGRLFRWSALVLAGLAGLWLLDLRDLELVLGITLLLGLVVAFAHRAGRIASARQALEPGLLDLGEWLAWVGQRASFRLAVLCVNRRVGKTGGLVRAMRGAFPTAALARWGRRHLLLAIPDDPSAAARDLVVASGGVVSRAWISSVVSPALAFEQARRDGALPDGWQDARERGRAAGGSSELIADFRTRFASGELLELGSGRSLSTRPVNAAILHELVRSIRARSRGKSTRFERVLPFEVAVFAPGGQAQAIFVVEKDAPGFDAFRARVRLASLHASWPHAFEPATVRAASEDARASEVASVR